MADYLTRKKDEVLGYSANFEKPLLGTLTLTPNKEVSVRARGGA